MTKKEPRSQINIRVTPKEKKIIFNNAKLKGYSSASRYIVDNTIDNIVVHIDTSNYIELVKQTRIIGYNVNNFIKNMRTSKYFTNANMLQLESHLVEIQRLIGEENKKIRSLENSVKKLTPKKLKEVLQNKNLEVPSEIIFEEVINLVTDNLLEFITLLEQADYSDMYISYIYSFIYNLIPDKYTYEELIEMEKEFYIEIKKVSQKMTNPDNEVSKEQYNVIKDLINKYRKQ